MEVVEFGADEGLRERGEILYKGLQHIQLEATVDGHPSHELLRAAIRPYKRETTSVTLHGIFLYLSHVRKLNRKWS